MKNNVELNKRLREIQGKRLTECMNMRGLSRTDARAILKEKYDYSISRQTFDKYEKGINSMAIDFVNYISEILEIHPMYLLGFDVQLGEGFEISCTEYIDFVENVRFFRGVNVQ